jgi:spermidine/putrescine transport system permease protein
MSTITQNPSGSTGARNGGGHRARSRSPLAATVAWVREHLVTFAGMAALGYLLLPIAVVFVFSFNNPTGRFNFAWHEFSLDAWTDVCGIGGMCDSLWLSIKLALAATAGATALGTLLAFALVRHRFHGRGQVNLLVFLPMATPEVVMGSSLLALFVQGGVDRGFTTLFIAHVLFCMSFVVVTVKARLQGMDPRLEQAAADLYATPYQTFRRVTLPLVLPGIVAAALLSFSLSFDDFIVTNFNSGNQVTFPMFVFGANQRGVPPQINVIGSIMFFLALALVLAAQYRSRLNFRRALK